MKYTVLKQVIVDGKSYQAGDSVETTVPCDRLVMQGFLDSTAKSKPVAKTENRAVGLEEETKPKKRTVKKKAD